jgi:hypothetical protein
MELTTTSFSIMTVKQRVQHSTICCAYALRSPTVGPPRSEWSGVRMLETSRKKAGDKLVLMSCEGTGEGQERSLERQKGWTRLCKSLLLGLELILRHPSRSMALDAEQSIQRRVFKIDVEHAEVILTLSSGLFDHVMR